MNFSLREIQMWEIAVNPNSLFGIHEQAEEVKNKRKVKQKSFQLYKHLSTASRERGGEENFIHEEN